MKSIFTLMTMFVAGLMPYLATAQVMQSNNLENYTQQVYIDLETQTMTPVDNDAWHIAFSAEGLQDAGVFINESTALSGQEPLRLWHAVSDDWTQPITDVSIYTDSTRLLNPDENWVRGAFNADRDPGDIFDYGWGQYNPAIQTVVGDRVFVIQMRDGSWHKFQLTALDRLDYEFTIADLDNSNERSFVVSKTIAQGGMPVIHFNLITGQVVDMPQKYDLIMQRYNTLAELDGQFLDYDVLGVMLAPGVEGVMADGVDPVTVDFMDYEANLEADPLVIGHEWKTFALPEDWSIPTDRAYFVRLADGMTVYKIVFYDFEGAETGISTFEVSKLPMPSSTEYTEGPEDLTMTMATLARIGDVVTITLPEQHGDGMLELFDMGGRLVQQEAVSQGVLTSRIVAPSSAGRYQAVWTEDKGIRIAKALLVQ